MSKPALKIAADLSIVGPNGEHLGQWPVLIASKDPKDRALCATITAADFKARAEASPELAPAIAEILKTDFKTVAAPQESAADLQSAEEKTPDPQPTPANKKR